MASFFWFSAALSEYNNIIPIKVNPLCKIYALCYYKLNQQNPQSTRTKKWWSRKKWYHGFYKVHVNGDPRYKQQEQFRSRTLEKVTNNKLIWHRNVYQGVTKVWDQMSCRINLHNVVPGRSHNSLITEAGTDS